jgi:1-acyl-sn-glycerol-3-phosphate acyltransferase
MFITLYDIIVTFFSVILDIFFREVKSRGSHKISKEGPVIFVAAPHANQVIYLKIQIFFYSINDNDNMHIFSKFLVC